MDNKQSTVLLVDDHPVFRRGMRSLLEDEEDIVVVGEAGDGKSALELIEKLSPEVVVMDVTMPELNGIEATKRILAQFPDTIVVALSIHAEKQFVQDMLQEGAAGYLLKDSGSEELIKGIRAVISGEGYLSPAITGIVVSQFRKAVTLEQSLQKMDSEIIETKFHLPTLPVGHVHRPRLLELLETNRHLALQCIIAPAGYGKTTLASDWLIKHQWPNAWISLDEDDSDLRKFISCFIYAVKTMFPDALSKCNALAKGGSLPPIQPLAALLVNELNLIGDDFILVFDDFHLISEKSVHDLLAEVLRLPLNVMHITILSRLDPFLPLSRLRAQNHLAEIRLNNLRFTTDETTTFLKSIFQHDIEQSISTSWNEKTEGWITGLRLAALSIRQQGDLDNLLHEVHGSRQYIKEYLFNEVWGRQPENIRRHLTAISILERFCAPLFDALCPCGSDECQFGGWDIIQWVKKNNLFQVSMDNEGQWYRFHHLFNDLLRNQLKRTSSKEEIDELHFKAGTWFAEHGYVEEAVNHILAAGRPVIAGELVAQLGHSLIDQERVVDLEKFLRKLPLEVINHNSLLLIYEAWLARVKLMIPKIAENLKRAEGILKRDPSSEATDNITWGYLHIIRGYERYCMLDQEGALSCAKRGLEMLPAEYPYMRAFASIIHAAVLQMTGKYRDALSIMKLAQGDPGLQRSHNQAILLAGLSPICMMEADEYSLQTVAARLLQLGQETDLPAYCGWGRLYLACSYYLRNNLEQAEDILVSHFEDRYLMYPDVVLDGAVILSLCHQQLGHPLEARHVADMFYQHALETDDPGLQLAAQAFQAELALRQGRKEEAIAWARVFEPRELQAHYFFFLPELTLAKVLIAEESLGSSQKAQSLLLDIERFSRTTCNHSVLIPTLLLQAIVLHSLETPPSLDKVDEAISLAQTGGGIRFFLDFGTQLKNILVQVQEKTSFKDFVGKLIAELSDGEKGNRQAMSFRRNQHISSPGNLHKVCLSDPLTDREQEILQQLVKGNSNKEIGENLFISIDTVKSHLKRIFQKLDVKSRLQAVTKATDFGVIDSE